MEIIKQETLIAPSAEDIQLTATLPHDMVVAQKQLIAWCEKKIEVVNSETEDLRAAAEHAKLMKWKSATLENQHRKSIKLGEYYEKIRSALLAGYYIVPNFPIQMFAIRKKWGRQPKGHSNRFHDSHEQKAMELPVGAGEYKNPFPVVERISNPAGIPDASYPSEWDEMEFPITMSKAPIMEATTTAMHLKVFDQIGVMPATRKKEDPVIIGQIFHKTGPYSLKTVSFMIAWHLNTNII